MKSELKKDLSTLTTVNERVFTKLIEKSLWCISDTVEKTVLNKEDTAEVDLGIGKLLINFSNDEIKYKFIPSRKLEESVADTILNERNQLEDVVEESLVTKLTQVYKTFF